MLVNGFLSESGSHTRRALLGVDMAEWDVKTEILAVLSDQISMLMYGLSGAKGAKPKQLPRPYGRENTNVFGADPIPISEFDDWWDEN